MPSYHDMQAPCLCKLYAWQPLRKPCSKKGQRCSKMPRDFLRGYALVWKKATQARGVPLNKINDLRFGTSPATLRRRRREPQEAKAMLYQTLALLLTCAFLACLYLDRA